MNVLQPEWHHCIGAVHSVNLRSLELRQGHQPMVVSPPSIVHIAALVSQSMNLQVIRSLHLLYTSCYECYLVDAHEF